MTNLSNTSKLERILAKGTEQEINSYLNAIHEAIDFYLCAHPYRGISSDQAGNIYFLKRIIQYSQVLKNANNSFNLVFSPANFDPELYQCLSDSLDSIIEDIVRSFQKESRQNQSLNTTILFLMKLRRSFHPVWGPVSGNRVN